jgi:tRNA dimethylallyltransferase
MLPLLIAIVGPTASGKTALSLALAEALGGEIVNCDSVAVYREFEIGTAKPSAAERARIAHHLIDVADPAKSDFTAGEYSRLARAALNDITSRGKTPIVAGGTGLYLRALIEGLFPGPQRSEKLRERLRMIEKQQGIMHLHAVLQRMDEKAAENIHPNDTPKIIRAIEICMAGREPMTEMWKQGRDRLMGYRIAYLGLNPERTLLYERINSRCAEMFERGLIAEAQELAHKYPHALAITNSPINSPGYRQSLEHLRGEMRIDEALASTQQAHRNYAKRQMTWFRGVDGIHWLEGFGEDAEIQRQAVHIVQQTQENKSS